MRVRMYCIEYINKNGFRDWTVETFFSKWEARRFAKRHADEIGLCFTIKGV